MEPLSVARFESVVKEHEKWDTNELIFELKNDKKFDVIPYLGEGPKAAETLSFDNPVGMQQKELIIDFKRQAASQGIHLTTIKSSTNEDSASGRHFTLGCHRHRVYQRQLVLQIHHCQRPIYDSIQPRSRNWRPLVVYKNLKK